MIDENSYALTRCKTRYTTKYMLFTKTPFLQSWKCKRQLEIKINGVYQSLTHYFIIYYTIYSIHCDRIFIVPFQMLGAKMYMLCHVK